MLPSFQPVDHGGCGRKLLVSYSSFSSDWPVCAPLTSDGHQRFEIRVYALEIGEPLHGALAVVVLQVVIRVQRLDLVVKAETGEPGCKRAGG